jgi:anti-sigma B factor antagonist
MKLRDRRVGDVTILDIDGRVAIEDGVDQLRAMIRQLLALSQTKLVFNLQGVPYIDSSALGEIIRAHSSVTRRGGALRLLGMTPRVKELLTITRVLPVFDLYDDETAAVKSLGVAQSGSAT